eukprot:CAMPEP_0171158200 /NCGR_PEP_ID=MMETSP0790-20130122/2373_1 /TAXON_ID=2925 /ORGANISM="Alexandrium catenella, Strain OF101" /LENGTH=209 /DNA_ID=CAMNT_0011622603 /DNA_START=38 /DNA_END=663 /DNA_ORIENTATION=+
MTSWPTSVGPIFVRDITAVPEGAKVKGYQVIPFVIVHSAFDEVLYLDADNVIVDDPTPVFSAAAYVETGVCSGRTLGTTTSGARSGGSSGMLLAMVAAIETGQLLVDRAKHRIPLELALFWNFQGPETYHYLSNGECDLFTFAWLALSATFRIAPPMSYAGYMADSASFCAHSFLHSDPDVPGRILFAHRTNCRFSATIGNSECRWTAI